MAAHVVVDGLVKRFGQQVAVDHVSFEVQRGEMVCLLGPSGCGKTTILRCIAGLEEPDDGEIVIDGRVVASPRRGIFVAPERRSIGMVFQSYAVWPHMTVFENVAYPLVVRRRPAAEVEQRVRRTLEMVGLAGLETRNVTRLSGGQQQRVALARSLAGDPDILLFDEPLSNLDARLREHMREEIRRLQRSLGKTAVYVTHDQAEGMALADRILVMNRGRVVQEGDARTLYENPANAFVANFVGIANLVPVRVVGWKGELAETVPRANGMESCRILAYAGPPGADDFHHRGAKGDGMLLVRPERVRLHPSSLEGSVNAFPGVVVSSVYLGDHLDCRVQLQPGGLTLRCKDTADRWREPGEAVWVELPVRWCRLLLTPDGEE